MSEPCRVAQRWVLRRAPVDCVLYNTADRRDGGRKIFAYLYLVDAQGKLPYQTVLRFWSYPGLHSRSCLCAVVLSILLAS